jgi:hypothetical protein
MPERGGQQLDRARRAGYDAARAFPRPVRWGKRRIEASVAFPTDRDITRLSHEPPAGFEECVDLGAFAPRADGAFGIAEADKPASASA